MISFAFPCFQLKDVSSALESTAGYSDLSFHVYTSVLLGNTEIWNHSEFAAFVDGFRLSYANKDFIQVIAFVNRVVHN